MITQLPPGCKGENDQSLKTQIYGNEETNLKKNSITNRILRPPLTISTPILYQQAKWKFLLHTDRDRSRRKKNRCSIKQNAVSSLHTSAHSPERFLHHDRNLFLLQADKRNRSYWDSLYRWPILSTSTMNERTISFRHHICDFVVGDVKNSSSFVEFRGWKSVRTSFIPIQLVFRSIENSIFCALTDEVYRNDPIPIRDILKKRMILRLTWMMIVLFRCKSVGLKMLTTLLTIRFWVFSPGWGYVCVICCWSWSCT